MAELYIDICYKYKHKIISMPQQESMLLRIVEATGIL